jgi:hypothetical protein
LEGYRIRLIHTINHSSFIRFFCREKRAYLFRIPKVGAIAQTWDEGVGYDYYDNNNQNTSNSSLTSRNYRDNDKSYSNRPSNWYRRDISNAWSTPGIYYNNNIGTGTSVNYTGLTQVTFQHFEFGLLATSNWACRQKVEH